MTDLAAAELGNRQSSQSLVFLTYMDNIYELLKFCPCCGSPTLRETFVCRFEGTLFSASGSCLRGCDFSWNSQPTLSSAHSNRSGLGDFQLASAMALCGSTYAVMRSVADCIRMSMFSHTTYDAIQRQYLAPAVFSAWHAQQTVLLQEMVQKPSVRLAGDGRSDSPGFSAKYMTYTLLDSDSGYVVMGRVVQLGQEASSSVGMEKVGLESCLDELLQFGVPVSVLTTDRSPSVIHLMKMKYSDVDHQHDIWHISKSEETVSCSK